MEYFTLYLFIDCFNLCGVGGHRIDINPTYNWYKRFIQNSKKIIIIVQNIPKKTTFCCCWLSLPIQNLSTGNPYVWYINYMPVI